ncbi:MAG: hypothetical protein IIX61_02490, partial [Loktanella sp.]|nr:hypothetical protein [Loktanella sp.]
KRGPKGPRFFVGWCDAIGRLCGTKLPFDKMLLQRLSKYVSTPSLCIKLTIYRHWRVQDQVVKASHSSEKPQEHFDAVTI